ncbi:FMN-dependent NADH-azoreductase [Clostridium felsineum]|uniref:FMN-dependent NADH-azoreductase n=1 Tax=Clostridium felsineum TaxID=36839 RepID=UPI00098BEE73|nr:FMN-dependent NADH-azoreductase [Clostridium felsineum]URZ01817.1 FMN-dependent NADH-azoreductase 2 [Clostridium felsineum]
MKKLLYISVNTKPENASVSKTVGREFINKFLEQYSEYDLIEHDLCSEYIPELDARFLNDNGEIVSGNDYALLSENDRKAVDRINQLCDEFISADVYVIAYPMWSSLFPSKLKSYIDCIIQNDKTIKISEDEVKGLLNDRERSVLCIQSSGGVYPKIISWKINHGINYLHDVLRQIGIRKFEKLLVEGVNTEDVGRDKAIEKAFNEIDNLIPKMNVKDLVKQ